MYCNLFTAWYCLGVLALGLLAYLVLLPLVGVDRATAAFGFSGLFGLLPFFWLIVFRKEKYDERDLSFMQRSLVFGFASGVGTLFFTASVLFLVYWIASGYDSDLLVPVRIFWAPATCGLFVGILSGSVLLLLFYYKGENADKEGCP